MSGNRSVGELPKTCLAETATLIGQVSRDDHEFDTVPMHSATAEETLLTEPDIHVPRFPSSSPDSPKSIGKYLIQSVLGQGGMGVVYKAFDPLIEREVALKVLSPEIARTPSALQRFLVEARSTGRLNHPHVVSIYEINQVNGTYFLVMELLTGGSVEDLAERVGALPWRHACRIAAEAARGLFAAHEAGLVHRDMKPANLMLTKDGSVKVVDFGLSKLLGSDISLANAVTRAGQLLGTPHFMSPEQFDGASVDSRTDTYALGATLYRLLTHQFPFQESGSILQLMKAHLLTPVPKASREVVDIPTECDRIIARAMAKDPADRYVNCNDMADDLVAVIALETQKPMMPTKVVLQRSPNLDRCLESALVVEPSRLQAAMRQDLLNQGGAISVTTAGTLEEARSLIAVQHPDLIWTSMELPDGRGIDWLRSQGRHGKLQQTTVVLNSSDCTVSELMSIGRAGSLILAPKTARLESIARVIHGAGPVRFSGTAMTENLNPASASIRLISDTGQIPEALAALFRELKLTRIEIVSQGRSAAPHSSVPCLTLLIRTADTRPRDETAYAAMVSVPRTELAAAIQSTSDRLLLRSLGHSSVIAILTRPLDAALLECLLQAGR